MMERYTSLSVAVVRRLAGLLVIVTLAACQSAPTDQDSGSVYPYPGGGVTPARKGPNGEASQPGTPPLTGEAARTHSHKMALEAAELLDQGREDEAREVLRQALSLDKDNRVAASLLRQIVVNPVDTLGTRSFRYTVRPGETLSEIARRFLGDVFEFYSLARYNDIRVPRDVRTGQVIKVPGDAPPPEPPPKPRPTKPAESTAVEAEATPPAPPAPPQPPASPAEATYQEAMRLLRAGQKDQAYGTLQQAVRLDPEHKPARAQLDQLRQELVQRHSRNALGAFHRQDLKLAIKEWDRVLELDPRNESARLKRQQAIELQERIKKFSSKP